MFSLTTPWYDLSAYKQLRERLNEEATCAPRLGGRASKASRKDFHFQRPLSWRAPETTVAATISSKKARMGEEEP